MTTDVLLGLELTRSFFSSFAIVKEEYPEFLSFENSGLLEEYGEYSGVVTATLLFLLLKKPMLLSLRQSKGLLSGA